MSSRSFSSWSTKAELLSARPPPTVAAALAVTRPPSARGSGSAQRVSAATPAAVSPNCSAPSPKTSRRMLISRSTLSSRPISKRKNTMPSSASLEVVLTLVNSFSPEGPMRQPTPRKPRMGDMPSFLQRGAIMAVANSSSSVSRFSAGKCRLSRKARACRAAPSRTRVPRLPAGSNRSASPLSPPGTRGARDLVSAGSFLRRPVDRPWAASRRSCVERRGVLADEICRTTIEVGWLIILEAFMLPARRLSDCGESV
mmetsp:Transcript_29659/g.46760  ORF Transcript_29659/g.46760 Transcript_29659/m.46760 type:complete len:256 (-) Transcript_29659:444-1211(-)